MVQIIADNLIDIAAYLAYTETCGGVPYSGAVLGNKLAIGAYWTFSLVSNNSIEAYDMRFSHDGVVTDTSYRYYGFVIRPVEY